MDFKTTAYIILIHLTLHYVTINLKKLIYKV